MFHAGLLSAVLIFGVCRWDRELKMRATPQRNSSSLCLALLTVVRIFGYLLLVH
ncbi:hypothetical protein BJX76DRAFT_64829 [Aspergillus varians]